MRKIVASGLVEARGQAAEAFETVEEALHSIPRRVGRAIEPRLIRSDRMRMNDRLHTQRLHARSDRVRVVPRVCEDFFAASVLSEDFFCDRRLVLLARRELDVERPTSRIDEGVDLRGESTSRTTQCIALDPPFPPAASWCARTIVASMMTPSSSTSI